MPGQKRVKDPNMPKRGMSAYFMYLAHCRKEAKAEGRTISKVAEFTKEASAVWREFTPKDKIPFDKAAATDKARYDKEMAIYRGKNPNAKSAAEEGRPKRGCTAYFYFLADYRKEQAGTGVGHKDIVKNAGEAWRNLDDEDKAEYEEKAAIDSKRYEKEKKAWEKEKASAPKKQKVEEVADNGADDDEEDDDDDEEEEEESDDE